MTEQNRGRPSKGPRDSFMTRPHTEVGRIIRARAEAEGYSYSDYIAKAVAHHIDRPDLAPAPTKEPNRPQAEELPLTG